MQWIEKRHEPSQLREWRLKNASDINFGYSLMRQDSTVRDALLAQLLSEQGRLCAYTGRRIGEDSCHMEHVKPQDFCSPEETVSYFTSLPATLSRTEDKIAHMAQTRKATFPLPMRKNFLFLRSHLLARFASITLTPGIFAPVAKTMPQLHGQLKNWI